MSGGTVLSRDNLREGGGPGMSGGTVPSRDNPGGGGGPGMSGGTDRCLISLTW